jgi:tetratricopeptide (TPR) repeat protein
MSRFEHLEFRDDLKAEVAAGSVKDDAYYLAEAIAAFQLGWFEPALRSYGKVLEHNPGRAAAWIGQVRMLIELGEFREAKVWADKALERFPREPELLAAKAVALGRTGDLDAALAFSDAAIEERGDTPYVWLARGDVLLARKEPRAEFCLDKATTLTPGDWFVLWLAARIRYYYGHFAKSLKLLQDALSIHAGHYLMWIELGHCQLELGFIAQARDSYTQARTLDPQRPEALLALGRAGGSGFGQKFGLFPPVAAGINV